jgi:DNA-binding Lrp family transcriptional regulator
MLVEYVGAYVLINTRQDYEMVRQRLLEMEGVILAHALMGPSDLIVYIDADGLGSLRSLLDHNIRGLIDEGLIESTDTRLVLTSSPGTGFTRDYNNPARVACWVLITVGVGDPEVTLSQLGTVEGVLNAHPVLGPHDIIAYIEAEDQSELMRILDEGILSLPGVARTDTRPVLMRRSPTRRIMIGSKTIATNG